MKVVLLTKNHQEIFSFRHFYPKTIISSTHKHDTVEEYVDKWQNTAQRGDIVILFTNRRLTLRLFDSCDGTFKHLDWIARQTQYYFYVVWFNCHKNEKIIEKPVPFDVPHISEYSWEEKRDPHIDIFDPIINLVLEEVKTLIQIPSPKSDHSIPILTIIELLVSLIFTILILFFIVYYK